MDVECMENGYIKIGVKQEDLEDGIAGLTQLKPILQAQVIKGNGADKRQAAIDSAELGKHFDTAIDAMTMLLGAFSKPESKADKKPGKCQLKEIPEEISYKSLIEKAREKGCFKDSDYEIAFFQGIEAGWNACINEILKECEDE